MFWQLLGQTLAANGEITLVVTGALVTGIMWLVKLAWRPADTAKAQQAVAALVTAAIAAFAAELAKSQYDPAAIQAWPLVFAILGTWVASMGTHSAIKRLRGVGDTQTEGDAQ